MSNTVTVCDKCERACCWQGVFMCDEARGAGTKEVTRDYLAGLDLENPSYWQEQSEEHDDNHSVSPAAMSDEQIALRDAMTVTAVSQAESVAAIAASLHSLLDGLCKSVERLERERDEMRNLLSNAAAQWHESEIGQIDGEINRASREAPGGRLR